MSSLLPYNPSTIIIMKNTHKCPFERNILSDMVCIMIPHHANEFRRRCRNEILDFEIQ
jgi:hypothetical protein